ncbi:uncharacterized protein LOC129700763 isoform X2 [Leucoraja erinacea]|uniref:uncharacterized protein LOC129700763 isoform X2 n=1 Tax=Leucoraja erinaceus TaxID=7782 RepID=UPI002455A121|nr:uncharacterized protein LOC129700763 isoform X2 [Leucoraja erinacea]
MAPAARYRQREAKPPPGCFPRLRTCALGDSLPSVNSVRRRRRRRRLVLSTGERFIDIRGGSRDAGGLRAAPGMGAERRGCGPGSWHNNRGIDSTQHREKSACPAQWRGTLSKMTKNHSHAA